MAGLESLEPETEAVAGCESPKQPLQKKFKPCSDCSSLPLPPKGEIESLVGLGPPNQPLVKQSQLCSGCSSQAMEEVESDDSDEEYNEEYVKQLRSSEGFDIDVYPTSNPKYYPCGAILPLPDLEKKKGLFESVKELADLAISDYNEKNETDYKLVNVVKANAQACRGLKYYITFEAQNAIDSLPKFFQALVWNGIKVDEVLLCRPKAIN